MVQAVPETPCRTITKAALLLLACTLSGCASAPDAINPVSWWHNLEGGPIAQKRLPPPGAAAPFPNLANVPTAPAFLPVEERDRISAALLADRTRSQQQAVLEPLPNATATDTGSSALTPAPTPAATPAPPPAQAGAASASMPAVTSQPPPTTPAQPAAEPASITAATAALPSVPLTPPPPPALAGIGMPGPPPAPFAATTAGGLVIGFPPGSALLPASDQEQLAALAHRRDGAAVAVTGFGDAKESDAVAQSAALRLGLTRAQAVAAALVATGVPESALRLEAQASGSGVLVRLLPYGASERLKPDCRASHNPNRAIEQACPTAPLPGTPLPSGIRATSELLPPAESP